MENTDIHLLLCGIGSEENNLKQYTKLLGLEKQIQFFGYRKDIKGLLEISDIFVMTSYREGLSRSIMETMARGLPCICSNIRGNIDLTKDKKGVI